MTRRQQRRTALTAAVMAGGKSVRMGQDKASLRTPDGPTLLERTISVARAVCDPVLVVGRERPADWPDPDTRFLPDTIPGLGPAGGLHSALAFATAPVLLLPCDLPRLEISAVSWLIDAFDAAAGERASEDFGGVAATTGDGQIEPLFAVYTPAVHAVLAERIAAGRLSLKGLIQTLAESGRFALSPLPPSLAPQLFNTNSPDEWKRATEAVLRPT